MVTQHVLNPTQIHLLQMFDFCRDEQSMSELKAVLCDYYAKKVQEEADRLWDEGVLDEAVIDSILNEHLRTAY